MKGITLLLVLMLFVTQSYASLDSKFDGELVEERVGHSAMALEVGNYLIYRPKAFDKAQTKKLVVMLHGCLQTPQEFLSSSRMDKWADQMGFAILLPVQADAANSYQCWNWWHPYNQQKLDLGYENEPTMIVRMIELVSRELEIGKNHVFIGGMSAGGAMANIIASCFPSKFQAVSMHSGVQFSAAGWSWWDVEALKDLGKYGSRVDPAISAYSAFSCAATPVPVFAVGHRMPAIIFQGTKSYMTYKHAEQIGHQYAVMNDYFDDGILNKSPQFEVSQEFIGERGGKYPYEVYRTYSYNQLMIERYKIHGLGHAWSGGDDSYDYNDSLGPDATALTINFFIKHGL